MINYLNKIENYKSLNYLAFLKKASSFNIQEKDIKDIFSIKKDRTKKGNFYFLEIENKKNYHNLFDKFKYENDNKKVQLSIHGNSKKAKSDYSYLLINMNYNDSIPEVVVFNKENYISKFDFNNLKSKLMIIENEDNFFNIINSFKNDDINLNEYNFVFGSGNEITDKNFIKFFDLYDCIYCYLDIDLGGLKTFSTLEKNLNSNVNFYFSESMKVLLSKYGKNITDKEYLSVLSYSDNLKLKKVISSILSTKKFAEQEIFQIKKV